MNINVEMVEVTPDLAQKWLKHQNNFRSLDQKRAMKLAGVVERNGWKNDGSPFRFDGEGVMIDGQHRCFVIYKLGLTVTCPVVRGVSLGDAATIDIVTPRTAAQHLAKMGCRNGSTAAYSLRLLLAYRAGEVTTYGLSRYSTPDITSLFTAEKEITHSLSYCVWKARHARVSAAHLTFLHYVCSKGGLQPEVEMFVDKLSQGEGLQAGDPILVLREMFARDASNRAKYPPIIKLALLITGWNKWIKGAPTKVIRWSSIGPKAEDFPSIILPSREEA